MKSTAHPPSERPLLVYDGDCGFCKHWVARWRAMAGERVQCEPFQQASARFPDVPVEQFRSAVQLIVPDGHVHSGAEAVFALLALFPQYAWMRWLYHHVPGARPVCELGYGLVADHRSFWDRIDRWLWGRGYMGAGHGLSRWLYLRLLGVVYLCAFASLGVQESGLYGSQGILPVHQYLDAVRDAVGGERFLLVPSAFWLHSGDATLRAACVLGVVLSLLLVANLAPRLMLILLWALYLSWDTVGQEFLSFQWDALLLEVGFLSIFLAPGGWRPRLKTERPPSQLALWLLRWTLFRLMFSSGAAKLASGDATWRNLTALTYHYETQPLPTVFGWYAHQLPVWFHQLCATGMFAIELAVPFLIFTPRRIRMLAAVLLIFLQALITLTGNYGFFNLLTVVLCILLLDDGYLRRFVPSWLATPTPILPDRGRARTAMVAALAGLFVLVGLDQMLVRISPPGLPTVVHHVSQRIEPFRLCNGYGLFAVMTTNRPEIILEGSDDRMHWKPYGFKWKPGPLDCPPTWSQPHMPRLDWQMWFAALGNYRQNRWFILFCRRLLEGDPEVQSLLAGNPFPDHPPRYLRASLYLYSFTDRNTRQATGQWWKRDRLGNYAPVMELSMFGGD